MHLCKRSASDAHYGSGFLELQVSVVGGWLEGVWSAFWRVAGGCLRARSWFAVLGFAVDTHSEIVGIVAIKYNIIVFKNSEKTAKFYLDGNVKEYYRYAKAGRFDLFCVISV